MIKFLKDKRDLVILLLSILSLIKIPQGGLKFFFWVSSGISLCCFFDLLINKFFFKRNIFPRSAIISGFIVSGIIDYREPQFVLFTFCLLAILSKHIIKFKYKHIFNPANFGLFLATLFRVPLTWNIEANIFLIIIFGICFAYFYKKFFHILGFLVFFIASFVISKINPIIMISWFFLFIMLIEPKTSGYGNLRGFVFGGICGVVSYLIFKFIPGYEPFISSLFIANLFNPFLERIKR